MAAYFTVALSETENKQPCYSCENSGRDVECTTLFPEEQIYQCNGFRLPTEAEWEFAARAGTTGAIWTEAGGAEIPLGVEFSCEPDQILSDRTPIAEFAWYCSSAESAQPVAQLKSNGLGFYDLSGNVWEWVHDGYGRYPEGPITNPVGPAANRHVLRGGRWGNEPYALRSAKRLQLPPDFWDGNYGFRVAISSP
jgi:formylglycine-generating enzyme required for sulfatase activity